MFYRRKIVLAVLQAYGKPMEKSRLQKLLFLLNEQKQKTAYDFVPYKYGCYSFSLQADIEAMIKRGYLSESSRGYEKADTQDYIETLTAQDRELLHTNQANYASLGLDELIRRTYLQFPYYASKSTIAARLLSEEELATLSKARVRQSEEALFTIGYEGISLEAYLNRLIQNDIRLLVDVRKNPLSMKYGFSKSLLRRFCEYLGIEYIHKGELGIVSEKRQTLQRQEDYDVLFEDYNATVLQQTKTEQNELLELLGKYKRIALTCFEANICQCHRLHLAKALEARIGKTTKHI